MFKRKFFKQLILLIAFTNSVNATESAGMPQLDPQYWISQIFWLIISFGFLLICLSRFILPKISNNLESRKSQILENIETADKQRNDSENKLKEFDKIIFDKRVEANIILNETTEKVAQDIIKKKKTLDDELNSEILQTEKEIQVFKKSAPEKVDSIAKDLATNILRQIIKDEINSSSISAIVEDLSKKNKEKYNVL